MTPPSEPATLSVNQSTTVSGDGGYSSVGTVEGWIQVQSSSIPHIAGVSKGPDGVSRQVVLFEDPQRLLSLTGTTLSGEKNEFWVEFSSGGEMPSASRKSGKLLFPGGNEVQLPFTDLNVEFHHFALTLDRDEGLSISFDGNDPVVIPLDDKTKADLLIQQLTIGHARDLSGAEHSGFNGKIAGLHLWKKPLTSTEIGAAGNWHASYCPTIDFGFKGIADPIELLGYLNPVVPSFIFYYEPRGHWVMESTENDEPKQEELRDGDQYHHAI